MDIVCLDLEGVLIPEVWINVANRTGIEALRLTTRDISDYDELMRHRLKVLDEHRLKLADIQDVIGEMAPFPGANDFLNGLKPHYQVVILSDTFYEFAAPLMKQLNWPTLFCHRLIVDEEGRVANYQLRMQDQKRHSVLAFQQINFHVIAAGDSYNDISMLQTADAGILYCPPDNVIAEFPALPVTVNYDQLMEAVLAGSSSP